MKLLPSEIQIKKFIGWLGFGYCSLHGVPLTSVSGYPDREKKRCPICVSLKSRVIVKESDGVGQATSDMAS